LERLKHPSWSYLGKKHGIAPWRSTLLVANELELITINTKELFGLSTDEFFKNYYFYFTSFVTADYYLPYQKWIDKVERRYSILVLDSSETKDSSLYNREVEDWHPPINSAYLGYVREGKNPSDPNYPDKIVDSWLGVNAFIEINKDKTEISFYITTFIWLKRNLDRDEAAYISSEKHSLQINRK